MKLKEKEIKYSSFANPLIYEKLMDFFENIPELCIFGNEKKVKLNKAWERLLRFSGDDLSKKRIEDLVHPDDLIFFKRKLKERESRFLIRIQDLNEVYHWIEWVSSCPDGECYYATGRIVDRMSIGAQKEVPYFEVLEAV